MTNFRKLTAGAALMSATALMSTSAFAMDDMSCGDFMAMDEDAQMEMAMMHGPDAGRAEAREEATGENSTDAAAEVESSTSNDQEMNDDSGQEGQRDMARGDEMLASMTEYCNGGPDLMLNDMEYPDAGDGSGQ